PPGRSARSRRAAPQGERQSSACVRSWSYCPAGAAERAPEACEIVDVTRVRVSGGQDRSSPCRRRPGWLAIGRGGVTAEAAHRRPIRHSRWRRGLVHTRELAGAVDDLAADDGEGRGDVGDLALGAGEVV